MKILAYKNTRYAEKDNTTEIECKGSGTEVDPFIIETSRDLPDSFELQEMEAHTVIRNLNLKGLRLNISKNIIIENCNFSEYLMLSGNSNIKIKSTKCGNMWMDLCDRCVLDNCFIPVFYISNSNDNKIRKCEITSFDYGNTCKGNIFEDNILDKKNQKKLEKFNSFDFKPTGFERYFFTGQEGSPPELKCKGLGIKSNPIIITQLTKSYKYANRIYETSHYVEIKDFKIETIRFAGCMHKTIDNCTINYCRLLQCNSFKLFNSSFKIFSFLGPCQDILIENCKFKELRIIDDFEGKIIFRNCTIEELKKNHCKGISFENTIIKKESELGKLNKIINEYKKIAENMLAIK